MKKVGFPILALALLVASAAVACPLCHSDSGKALRAGIFNEDFLFNFTVVLLPFLIFTLLVLVLHYWPRNKKMIENDLRDTDGDKH